MAVCKAKNCKKRESCMNYIENYFDYNPSSGSQQLIDWSTCGVNMYCEDEYGNTFVDKEYSCGDDSVTYPLFFSTEKAGK